MWIQREITALLEQKQAVFIQVVIGPRQSGKSSLLSYLGQDEFQDIEFDDLQLRKLANNDPALFLSQNLAPLNLDEVQYVPNLFPELKKRIDLIKKENLLKGGKNPLRVLYRLTGSNIILLSKNIQESLVGRAQYFYLNTLSVSEIKNQFKDLTTTEILFKGGFPELHTNLNLKVQQYLDDYVRSYVEKDIAQSAGIEKLNEFGNVLGMVAARVGQLINYSDIAKDSGVKSVTVKEWVSVLEKSQLVSILKPYESNLNKRLTKTPKIYFWDSGLVVRLQGWSEVIPMSRSPYIGSLFENLVWGEIAKFKQNHGKTWPLFFWRTKEGEEIDFILEIDHGTHLAIEAKWSLSLQEIKFPKGLNKDFPSIKEIVLVVPSGEERTISEHCKQISIDNLSLKLSEYL